MTRVKTKCEVEVYEVDHEAVGPGKDLQLIVESDRIHDDRAVLVIGTKRYTVVASDMRSAIDKVSR